MNILLNGNFNLWPEGDALGISGNTNLNGMYAYMTNSGTWNVTRSTDVPDSKSKYSLEAIVTTADATVAAGDFMTVSPPIIEGSDWLLYHNQPVTLSFKVKSNKPGIYCASFHNSVDDRVYIAEYTINAANTWEPKSITLNTPVTGGTWDFTNGIGMAVMFALACGSAYQGTACVWNTAQCFSTANQVNLGDTVGNYIRFSQIKLEPGTTSTAFDCPTISQESAALARYIEILTGMFACRSTYCDSSMIEFQTMPFSTQKRISTSPTFIAGTPNVDYRIVNLTGTIQSGFTFSWVYSGKNGATIRATKTGHGLTDAYIQVLSTAKIRSYAGY